MIIISGMYEGHRGIIEANVYQRTADYPEELANRYHVMLETEKLVTVRSNQVEAAPVRTRYLSRRKLLGSFTPNGLALSSRNQFQKHCGIN